MLQKYGNSYSDERLFILIENFLGSMNESRPAYRNWHEMGILFSKFDMRHNNFNKLLHDLEPHTSSSFAICAFGFNNVLSRWWEDEKIRFERTVNGKQLLELAASRGDSNTI